METPVETHPPDFLLVHRLPPAPHFVGRETELQELRDLWQTGFRGVLALVGLGGAGKTAVAARFLDDLLRPDCPVRPEGLFVWSFYQEPDADQFLQQAYHYFARPATAVPTARGAGLLHLLREALAEGGPHLLVLDGLERVQCQQTTSTEVYGQIEDPLLKGLLTRMAEGIGRTAALVTSRFPLTDLEPLQGHGYRHLNVGGLEPAAARALLRARGVQGEDAALTGLVENYGAHALTLDHLGGLLGQFLEGDPRRAPELPALTASGTDRQALRLARLLRAYENHLPPAELALLCRLCLLRRSVHEEHLLQLFLCTPEVHARTVRELGDMILQLGHPDRYPRQNLLGLGDSLLEVIQGALCSAPIAGPEETFRQEVCTAAEKVLEMHQANVETADADIADLARLYADKELDAPTDLRPLSPDDRQRLRELCGRYLELRKNPLLPFKETDPLLEESFQTLGYAKPPRRKPEDLSPADVLKLLRRVWGQIRDLVFKHFALRRVRELCRVYQRKWALAGPLAPLDAVALRQVLDALVGRHLVLREADGSFSVHPAVRDHFGRLANAPEQGAWHDILREQLVNLVQRPGRRLPEDAATLDLVEEAIYHALQAGRPAEAWDLYADLLGGLRHLAWKLGEMNRGLRILRGFDPCPDRWALAWYLRALGEFDQAFAHNDLPYFRADILLLQGRLPQVAAAGDSTRTPIAAFLMGKTQALPPDQLAAAIPREQILLYLGRLHQVRRSSNVLEGFYQTIGWEGDRARSLVLLAEVARRQAEEDFCRKCLAAASAWILHSGSVEHLCLLHLVRARVARSEGELVGAERAVEEGLHVARHCGLGLYHIELLCEQAEIDLAREQAPAAEKAAREALRRASALDCQFLWGAAEAGHLLGRALAGQRRFAEARDFLTKTLALRRRIGHPGAEATQHLLASNR
jgi:hypothetical protein